MLGIGGAKRSSLVPIASRSFVFGDMDSALDFQADLQAGSGIGGGSRRNGFLAFQQASFTAGKYGGHMVRSTMARELRVYGYEATISANSREYLFARDPTAAMFVEKPFTDMWNGFPLTYVPAIDAFFAQQLALGLLTALQASYQEQYQEGGGFILLETNGSPKERVRRGERPVAWTFIPARNVLEDPQNFFLAPPNNTDPLLDHGIEFIDIYPNEDARATGQPMTVHGSRLIPVNLDARFQKWWRTPNVPLNRIYDTLWELRDIIFARSRSHFQGDPIVVDVDLSADAQKALGFAEMNETQKTALSQEVEQSIVDYNTGAKTSFAPVMGFKMRRLGAASLPDPKEDVMMLSSRLAHGGYFPVKMVLASTKGASDVGDQDLLIYAGNLQNVRNTWGYKHLAKALLMGRTMGVSGLRMQDEFDLPPPQDLVWPLLRPLSPRDAAFTDKTDIAIYRQAQEASVMPPARLQRKFAPNPAHPLPLWLAARGRDTDGKNTDVDPANEPGSSGDGVPAKAAKRAAQALQDLQDGVQAVQDRLEEPLEATSHPERPENTP